ncbi:hypothetical protein [Streptomyces sp. XD-27]|uniref:terpene synthase family protein n=1 Tax=Streptomyces sp. XD-27 TaxID=3062779 RepID=UPI0026F4585E|nr:hypothetical protein [Streptomyces sp. XD-27]WKX70665.1 hypothetical protein Q3Y56_12765 [Streptomyces sp. XD-27]
MPQDIALDIPFPSRISSDAPRARALNLEWLTSERLLTSQENVDRYLSWNLSDLAGRFHPDAVGDDLVLGLQQQTFYFFVDDLFDSYLGDDPHSAYSLCHELASLARQRSTRPTFPLAEVFLDLWARSCEGMSHAWRERAARNWEQFFLSYAAEAANRRSGAVLGLEVYMKLRRISIGAQGVLDLTERCGHFEAPAEVHESSCVREMRDLTAEIVILTNDLASLEKDEANQEPNNTVLLLSLERRISRDKAIECLRNMVRERMARFAAQARAAEQISDLLPLNRRQRRGVARFIAANRTVMRGNYDWGRFSRRYDRSGVRNVRRSPRIEDRVSTTPYDKYTRPRGKTVSWQPDAATSAT